MVRSHDRDADTVIESEVLNTASFEELDSQVIESEVLNTASFEEFDSQRSRPRQLNELLN